MGMEVSKESIDPIIHGSDVELEDGQRLFF